LLATSCSIGCDPDEITIDPHEVGKGIGRPARVAEPCTLERASEPLATSVEVTDDELGLTSPLHASRSILLPMRIATGKVVGGKVVVDGAPLEEGASVTVLARGDESGFTLSPEEEAELLLSIAEADREEMVSGEEVLERLRRRRRG
jgi:hypothetical protein